MERLHRKEAMERDKWLELGYIWKVERTKVLIGLNYTEGSGRNQG